MTSTLHIGDFDSEKYWRSDNQAKLPSIQNNSELILLAMDELLFAFCKKEDTLVTRFAFDKALKDYLRDIGFQFQCSTKDFHTVRDDTCKTIFEVISRDESKFREFLKAIEGCTDFSPYSIVPYWDVLVKKAGLNHVSATLEAVKKVNSKEYSTILGRKLGFGLHSEIVKSSFLLLKKGRELLEKGNFLIKDMYGVSGKGSLLISSQRILERIVKYIESSEAMGKVCNFVIEKLLDKELDFSCSLIIDKDGKSEVLSIQKIYNQGFMYLGSESADPQLISFLAKNKYFEIINMVSDELYKDGYFGEVCVDSMVLKSGEIVPVVEINARKSMGLINSRIDLQLSKHGVKGNLMHISLGIPAVLTFEDILDKLKYRKVLYSNGQESGVIPLSSNTIFLGKKLSETSTSNQLYMGRMYISVIGKDTFKKEKLLRVLASSLEELSCKIYSKL